MTSTYFISDLHLDAARPLTSRAFFRFLNEIDSCESLYILGDLFEAWPGDDNDDPLTVAVCEALSKFNVAGSRTYLMQGNRDFLLGEDFCSRSNSKLLPESHVIDLYGEQALLMHGDTLCTEDVDYQAFRKTVRDPAWQAEVLALPLEKRRKMASKFREQSHEAKSNKAEDIVDVSPQAVDRALKQAGVAHLIHGHTHRAGHFSGGHGQRWVLGDWEHNPYILKVNSQEWELEFISLNT